MYENWIIVLRNIRKQYGTLPRKGHKDLVGVKALSDINLEIDRSKITVIKGSSGSGKTTLLSIIGCMAKPTSGKIFIDGIQLSMISERVLSRARSRLFGFMFQDYHLIRGLTSLENIMLPAYPGNHRMAVVRKKALSLMEKFSIENRAKWRVEHLSGGERQRVALSRALINDPPVIIADEPTAHLNSRLTRQLMAAMAQLEKEGKTILIATHDPVLIESGMVHQVFEIKDGILKG